MDIKTNRIIIDLTPALYERLNRMEELAGAPSKADVVRDALRLYEFLIKKASEGYDFSMKRGDAPSEPVVLFEKI